MGEIVTRPEVIRDGGPYLDNEQAYAKEIEGQIREKDRFFYSGMADIDARKIVDEQIGSNRIKWWIGTRAEFNAVAVKDPMTLYMIKAG